MRWGIQLRAHRRQPSAGEIPDGGRRGGSGTGKIKQHLPYTGRCQPAWKRGPRPQGITARWSTSHTKHEHVSDEHNTTTKGQNARLRVRKNYGDAYMLLGGGVRVPRCSPRLETVRDGTVAGGMTVLKRRNGSTLVRTALPPVGLLAKGRWHKDGVGSLVLLSGLCTANWRQLEWRQGR